MRLRQRRTEAGAAVVAQPLVDRPRLALDCCRGKAPPNAARYRLMTAEDISKLPPGRQLERLPAGLGIMADDWAASAWMAVTLIALRWLAQAGGVPWI